MVQEIRGRITLPTIPVLDIPDGESQAPFSARAEPERLATLIGGPGAHLLNYAYEWGCTAGAALDADGAPMLLRTLDWPFEGLGRALIVTRARAAAGPYLSATWPGYAGVLTGLAPGRFAAAINQPPLPWPGWGKPIGCIANPEPAACCCKAGKRTVPPRSHSTSPDLELYAPTNAKMASFEPVD